MYIRSTRPPYLKIAAHVVSLSSILALSVSCVQLFMGWVLLSLLYVNVLGAALFGGRITGAILGLAAMGVGGFLGWVSLLRLLCSVHKPWRSISILPKIGCFLGVLVNIHFQTFTFPSKSSLAIASLPIALLLLLVFQTAVLNKPTQTKTPHPPLNPYEYGPLLISYVLCLFMFAYWVFCTVAWGVGTARYIPFVIGSFGGFVGWISLARLVNNEGKLWEDIPASIKIGLCGFTLVGAISPKALLFAIPPAVLFTILLRKMRNHNSQPVRDAAVATPDEAI